MNHCLDLFWGMEFQRERERETDRQTDRQTDRDKERDRETERDRERGRGETCASKLISQTRSYSLFVKSQSHDRNAMRCITYTCSSNLPLCMCVWLGMVSTPRLLPCIFIWRIAVKICWLIDEMKWATENKNEKVMRKKSNNRLFMVGRLVRA